LVKKQSNLAMTNHVRLGYSSLLSVKRLPIKKKGCQLIKAAQVKMVLCTPPII
jgi:hypothetical protein